MRKSVFSVVVSSLFLAYAITSMVKSGADILGVLIAVLSVVPIALELFGGRKDG